MNKAVKKRWIKALRSGDYEQGKGVLHRSDGAMCCLGVLYDIEFDGDWELDSLELVWTVDGRRATMSQEFKDKMGIKVSEEECLIQMNDNNSTFGRIANHIEMNL